MKISAILLLALAAAPAASTAAPASAEALAGVFNTGPSLEKEAAGASLKIRFHPCSDDQALTCATVLETVEPNGPSGQEVLPNGDPVVGYVFIRGLKPKGDGKYRGGRIAAIDESLVKGRMIWYDIKIDDKFDGTLAATGCLGFICPRKMVWTSVEAP